MSHRTTEKPVPCEGTRVFDRPQQLTCPWWQHWLPGNWALHTTTHAISLTGQRAHVSACDGKEYSLARTDAFPHTRAGEMMPWDLDFSEGFYNEAFSVTGTKFLDRFMH